jgi:hypothetical protein
LEPDLGAGLSFLAPEAGSKKKATSSQGLFADCCFPQLSHAFSFSGVASCRTTGQTQPDGNIAATTNSETEAYADAPETHTDAAKGHTDVAPKS